VRSLALDASLLASTVTALFSTLAIAAPIDSDDIRVIDGDTIRIDQRAPNVRLVGFNAPETRNAGCEAERELGGRATRSYATSFAPVILISNMLVQWAKAPAPGGAIAGR
jgi:endonuclease YncB( thermonuclease family)